MSVEIRDRIHRVQDNCQGEQCWRLIRTEQIALARSLEQSDQSRALRREALDYLLRWRSGEISGMMEPAPEFKADASRAVDKYLLSVIEELK